ncbi:hypothetical protein NON20_06245 [Synechocystis sp. B12]|nr:hypothetical protein NON20_06245 [Synechocystis sp. B12]
MFKTLPSSPNFDVKLEKSPPLLPEFYGGIEGANHLANRPLHWQWATRASLGDRQMPLARLR